MVEGERERVQAFEGVCIARKNAGINSNFTLRKISYGEGVERIFPLYSPRITAIEVVRRGAVRRAKLYYLRGSAARRRASPSAAATPPTAEAAAPGGRRPRTGVVTRWLARARFSTRSGTAIWSISRRTAPASSISTAISCMR